MEPTRSEGGSGTPERGEPPPGPGAPPPAGDADRRSFGGHARAVSVAAAVAVALAFAGFTFGTRPAPEPSRPHSPLPSTAGEWVPGQRYSDLRDRRFGAQAKVTSDVALLRRQLPTGEPPAQSPADRRRALAERAERRAYDGAPPTIPHAIDQQGAATCLTCHEQGMKLADKLAPRIPHPPYESCTQCHVPSLRQKDAPPPLAANTFTGAEAAGPGSRAWVGAPPTIPHPTWMRESCASCHGREGRFGLRTPHPENVSCEQCHVPAQASVGVTP